MAASFFFYDLETSGISSRTARVMQFAGQRTDMDLKPIGEPVNILIKLTPDVLPDPIAILLTGITPQATLLDGITEAEFLKFFYKEVVKPGTIFTGFNSIRFDDEFMRFLHYRNFYDAYEWEWADDCSRWDILDVIRTTRALKPEGIEWPVTDDGKPTNRLELLTKANGLAHEAAHDALSDVTATIEVAKLIKSKQPKLFDYLLNCRGKAAVKAALQDRSKVFTYVSGRYPSETLHTTAAVVLGEDAQGSSALVYDLRMDPSPYLNMSVEQLIEAWQTRPEPGGTRFPVKALKYNHCPAIVPGFPKDEDTQTRLQLTNQTITKHFNLLNAGRAQFAVNIQAAQTQMDSASRAKYQGEDKPVDEQLYDGFFDGESKTGMSRVRAAKPDELSEIRFKEPRLQKLLPLYKARNYPQSLSSEEKAEWDTFCKQRLVGDNLQNSPLAEYFKRLQALAEQSSTDERRYILEELQLYGELMLPDDVAG